MGDEDAFQVLQSLKRHPDRCHLPALVVSRLEGSDPIARCIELGAEDCLPQPFDPVLLNARVRSCLEKKWLRDREIEYLRQVEREKRRVDMLLHAVIPIGIALAAESDFNRLLERILLEAKSFCGADAGTLYLRTDDDLLRFVMVHTGSLSLAMGGTTGVEIPFPPLRLYDERTGAPRGQNVAVHVAVTGQAVNIADAYEAEGFDFSGTRAFDQRTGYRSCSFLTVPLENSHGRVIGVLQLINALDPVSGAVIPFDQAVEQVIGILSSLAAVALESYIREQGLRRQIEELRIEINEARKAQEVAEITETEYFQSLQERARELRASARQRGS
jgi:GAF domain-containing protein